MPKGGSNKARKSQISGVVVTLDEAGALLCAAPSKINVLKATVLANAVIDQGDGRVYFSLPRLVPAYVEMLKRQKSSKERMTALDLATLEKTREQTKLLRQRRASVQLGLKRRISQAWKESLSGAISVFRREISKLDNRTKAELCKSIDALAAEIARVDSSYIAMSVEDEDLSELQSEVEAIEVPDDSDDVQAGSDEEEQ